MSTRFCAQQFLRERRWLLEEKYCGAANDKFLGDCERLAAGEPLAYVIGNIPFLGCTIDLSLRPFIPRPETEYWVEKAIEILKRDERPVIRCLDVFAGSGCIGLAVLQHVPNARVDFAEKAPRFLEQIRINIQRHYRGLASIVEAKPPRYRVIRSDIFSNVRGHYDYIFANPPYVVAGERVQQSVLNYEPHEALFAGPDGLAVTRQFLEQAKSRLSPGGKIYMEFGARQKEKIGRLLRAHHYRAWRFDKDQYGCYSYIEVVV